MWLPLASPEIIAKEIKRSWGAARGAASRPFNRFDAEESRIWWVVPSDEVPTFRFTKVIVSTAPEIGESGHTFVGLHCEKGLGPRAAALHYYPDHLIMDQTWSWTRFIADLSNGELQFSIAEASRRIDQPLEIRVDAHVPVIPRAKPGPPSDRLIFHSASGGSLTAARPALISTVQAFLGVAASTTLLPQLANALRHVPDEDYAWIDFCLGASIKQSPDPGLAATSPARLAADLLDPLARWFY